MLKLKDEALKVSNHRQVSPTIARLDEQKKI
jgi:hypothetical protein